MLAVSVDYNLVLRAQVMWVKCMFAELTVQNKSSKVHLTPELPLFPISPAPSPTGRADKSNDGAEVRVVSSR